MKYMETLGPWSVRTGVLVHFTFAITLAIVMLPLIYTFDLVGGKSL